MKRIFFGLALLVMSSVALAGRVGSWFYVVDHDPLDDHPTIKLGSPAEGGVGRMVVFCKGVFVEMIVVDWQSYIGFEADTLKYRFDDAPIVVEEADMASSGEAVIFRKNDVFDEMQKHERLHIRAEAGHLGETDTLTIDLRGFKEVVEKNSPDCMVAL